MPEAHGLARLPRRRPRASAAPRHASLYRDAWGELGRNPLFLSAALFAVLMAVVAVAPQLFTSADPRFQDLSRTLERPSAAHWFGFDVLGRDYYARVVYGARASIAIGLLVTASAMAIAVVGGAVAGYYGGASDSVISRVTDVWFAVPTVLGAIVLLSVLGRREGILTTAAALTMFGWTTMLRLMRSSVLAVKEQEYVAAAAALGAGDWRLLRRHILPNAIAPVVVYATIFIGIVIATEASLTFLGVGLSPPAISWGLQLSEAKTRVLAAPHLLLFPGSLLSLTVLSFIVMGDALRDAFDPKLR